MCDAQYSLNWNKYIRENLKNDQQISLLQPFESRDYLKIKIIQTLEHDPIIFINLKRSLLTKNASNISIIMPFCNSNKITSTLLK